MPLLSPSRIAVVVLSVSLLTFLWTFGLPHQPPQPSFPIIHHDGPHVEKPANNNPDRPGLIQHEQGQELETSYLVIPRPTPTPTPRPNPIPNLESSVVQSSKARESEVPEVDEEEEGRVPQPQQTQEGDEEEDGREKEFQHPHEFDDVDEEEEGREHEHPGQHHPSQTQVKSTHTPIVTGKDGTEVAASTAATTPASSQTPEDGHEDCRDVLGAANIMVIVKTSKAEIKEKLPTHLKTLLSCVPNFLIFSDHSGEIDGFTVHDALEDISDATKSAHSEFEQYEEIQSQDNVEPGSIKKDLDKWKFLPMVYRAYKMRSYSRFYVFIEADTSLSWTNLLQWIDRLDYRIPYYSGAPSTMGSVKFAQRGSGILLSNGALRQYAKSYDEMYTSEWEPRVGKECCGDMVLATALTESHVEFYSAFPLLQSEKPATIDWSKKKWCVPAVSWHHMNKEELELVWDGQQNWTSTHGWKKPFLIRDAFAEHVEPYLEEQKENWDNLSQDTKIVKPESEDGTEYEDWLRHGEDVREAVESVENCQRLCNMVEDCLQWKFSTHGAGACNLGKVIRLGKRVEKGDNGRTWTSGWMMERIQSQIGEWECKEPQWRFNQ